MIFCFSVFSSDILSGLQTKQAWQSAACFYNTPQEPYFFLFTYFIRRVLGKIFPKQIKVAKFVSVISTNCSSWGFSATLFAGDHFSPALSSSPTCRRVEYHQSLLSGKDLSTGSTWVAGINYSCAWSQTVHMPTTFWKEVIKCLLCDAGWLIQKAEASSAYFKYISLPQILRLSRDQMIFPFLGEVSSDLKPFIMRQRDKVAEVHPAFPSLCRAMCFQMFLFHTAQ